MFILFNQSITITKENRELQKNVLQKEEYDDEWSLEGKKPTVIKLQKHFTILYK